MKSFHTLKLPAKLPELYARWRSASWPLLTGRSEPLPTAPAPKEQPDPPDKVQQDRRAEQDAAHQEWEDEGGSVDRR